MNIKYATKRITNSETTTYILVAFVLGVVLIGTLRILLMQTSTTGRNGMVISRLSADYYTQQAN